MKRKEKGAKQTSVRRAQNLVAVPAEKFEGMLGKRRARAELRNQGLQKFRVAMPAWDPRTHRAPGGCADCPCLAQRVTALAGGLSHGPKAGRPSRDRHHVPPGQDIPSPVPAWSSGHRRDRPAPHPSRALPGHCRPERGRRLRRTDRAVPSPWARRTAPPSLHR